jgi:hypothetical protein
VVTILATFALVARCNVLINGQSKFAVAISRAMPPRTQTFQVDKGRAVFHSNHSNSQMKLQQMLDKRRKRLEIAFGYNV